MHRAAFVIHEGYGVNTEIMNQTSEGNKSNLKNYGTTQIIMK